MEKTALVLAGGGSRGSYQIGVWQALVDLNIEVDIVTGTSVGALNAALIAMGDIEKATAMWKTITTSMILSVELDETLPIDKKVKLMVKRFFEDYVKQGGTDSYPLKQLIDQTVDEQTIRTSHIECGIVVVDKATLKPSELFVDEIEQGQFADYLLASSSLFPAIKSCQIGENTYIDGGYYDNLPIGLALKRGATKIIAVDLESIGIKRSGSYKKAQDLTTIKSYWDLGPILVFDREIILRNIHLGYLDTMKLYGAFDGKSYTFIKGSIAAYSRVNREWLRRYNAILGVSYTPSHIDMRDNLFYMKIANHLGGKYAKITPNNQITKRYSNYLMACMESAGQIFSIDPTKIYTHESFTNAILAKVNTQVVPFMSPIGDKGLKKALSLLDKKNRTIYLAYNIKQAIDENKQIDTLSLALFMPDEFLAAYYLALID